MKIISRSHLLKFYNDFYFFLKHNCIFFHKFFGNYKLLGEVLNSQVKHCIKQFQVFPESLRVNIREMNPRKNRTETS